MGDKYASGLSNRCVATAGVSILIDLNFGILKILLFFPILSDQYRTLPFEVIRTAIAANMIGTANRMMIITANRESKILFI